MGLELPIAPPVYVILHKLLFRQQGASIRHLDDVRRMLRVLGDSVNVPQLRTDATALGVADEWREMEGLLD